MDNFIQNVYDLKKSKMKTKKMFIFLSKFYFDLYNKFFFI